MARVLDGVGARVVIASIDVVSRLRLPLFAYLLHGLSGLAAGGDSPVRPL